jgi:predicted ABC-class ATPase
MERLRQKLSRIDGRGYKAYKDLKGTYRFPDYELVIDYVQGDPFAAPSRFRARMAQQVAGFPEECYRNRERRIALEDFLTRSYASAIDRFAKGHRGTGGSGLIGIDRPGQEILERSSVHADKNDVEVRFVVGLPAFGRRVAAREAAAMLFDELPRIIEASLFFPNLSQRDLYRHIERSEDQDFIRSGLRDRGLVAFLANGSILPRASGVDDRPLREGRVVPFQSPPSLEVAFDLPNGGPVRGMGIPEGVTLIVGGGYHGKSTLLRALERGIYNHIPGDGRDFVVTDSDAVKIRAEDGRRVEKVGLHVFISNLPYGQETHRFSTENASGSTSQAANILEMLEVGARVLLIDEDTSATNFMIRDRRMQELVAREKEPITAFIDKVQMLRQDLGVSTVLVMGGSGDYFDVADRVIMMDGFVPRDVSDRVRGIREEISTGRKREGGSAFGEIRSRIPSATSVRADKGRKEKAIKVPRLKTLLFGRNEINLGAVEQLVDDSQTRTIGEALYFARKRYMDGRRTVREVIELVIGDLDRGGFDTLSGAPVGHLARVRKFEIAAALNRLRTFRIIETHP